jgi:ATP-dependent exoDNAse (exonuclease V) beta subunit
MSDLDARKAAVEPQRSVIVQAPAGSGKTTLLAERYLALLGVVESPEEILAITFTRKAAAEMRARVLHYLDPETRSDAPHEQAPLARARAIRAKVESWRLRDNPERLLIRTIDSFNLHLARTMPVATALGPVPAPAENPRALYREAARKVLALIDEHDALTAHVETLLEWHDHRAQDLEDLLADMLGKRDQWLRALAVDREPQRARLEAVLHALVTARLEAADAALRAVLPSVATDEARLVRLLRFAASTGAAVEPSDPIAAFRDATALPAPVPEALPRWRALAYALLTKEGEFRKRVNIGQGFPPKTPETGEFNSLLKQLLEHEDLASTIHAAQQLPDPVYDDTDWGVLDALVRVLERTAAELRLVFARTGQSDYAGLAAAALHGLGDAERGFTDLGLYLDRRIRHILVDEFQDTNYAQMHLLEKLTAGWERGDGRTLFLVGDPMQSIYRFREAEVGLFIRARDRGIGDIALESLPLTQNFRSRAEIVDFVNLHVGRLFPTTEDVSAGAIAYAPSHAARPTGGAVDVMAHASEADEADAIAALVAEALSDHAAERDFKAAIIVRARTHLSEIVPALQRRGVRYRAVKLDGLVHRPVVQDLLALTRAIVAPADTTAWLAVLRSPVCGLTLADLHALAGDGRSPHDADALDRLAPGAAARARRVFDVLAAAHAAWRRLPVRDLVEGAWHALGGPQCGVPERVDTDRRDANAYLDALATAEASGVLDDWNGFDEVLKGVFTEGDAEADDVRLEILTMHAAKGLEWDLVVLPALHRRPRLGDSDLLHWLPFTDENGTEQVLLAPRRSAEQGKDSPHVKLIGAERKAREGYENRRLLYVACTRAKERLVLSACFAPEEDGSIEPASNSLLAIVWPTTGQRFVDAYGARSTATRDAPQVHRERPAYDQMLRRVDAQWRPDIADALDWRPALPLREHAPDVEYDWAGAQARRIGTVLHRLLERVGTLGIEQLEAAERARLVARIPVLLEALGTRRDELGESSRIVRDAFERTLDDATGQWLLSNRHRDAACELPISGLVDGQLVNAIVDRTFVDDDGVRWIVDFKSGYHAGAELDAFLAQERERYAEQLARYRELFARIETRPVRTALYLPRHSRLEVVHDA